MDETKFGKWTVTGKDGRHLLVRCDCGAESRALPHDLRTGKTTMCRACKYTLKRGTKRPEVTKHGMSDSPTQWVWSDMKRRCYSSGRRGYENYGGRGIRVCDRWLHGDGQRSGFECFLADMGVRPSIEYQLDRSNNDGNYEPGNCRWVKRDDQNYNKRNTYRFSVDGELFTLEEAEARYGVPRSVLYQRLTAYRMSPEEAIAKPVRRTSFRRPHGITQ